MAEFCTVKGNCGAGRKALCPRVAHNQGSHGRCISRDRSGDFAGVTAAVGKTECRAFHVGKVQFPAAAAIIGHLCRACTRGLRNLNGSFLHGCSGFDSQRAGTRGCAVVHVQRNGQVARKGRGCGRRAHVKLGGRRFEGGLGIGIAAVHGLDVGKLQIARPVNAGNAAAHLSIDGSGKIAVGFVACDFDRKFVAVLHYEVVGKICGISDSAAHIKQVVGLPSRGCPRRAHAHKVGAVNNKAVVCAGAFARNLKHIARAGLNYADLDAGIADRAVDHARKGVERGVGRNVNAVFLACV